MKNLMIILSLLAFTFSNCKKKPIVVPALNSFIVGGDQKANGDFTAVQWINGKETFLSDTSANSLYSYAYIAIKNGADYYAFGTKSIAISPAPGVPASIPMMWKNGVESALPIIYPAGRICDVAFVNNDMYVLTGEFDANFLPTQTGHLVLYKNGNVVFDKSFIGAYGSSYMKVINNRVYVATTINTGTFSKCVCYQDGIEIFASSPNRYWNTIGLEVVNDEVHVFANYSDASAFGCSVFKLGTGEIKITNSKRIVGTFIKDNTACAIVRNTNNYNSEVLIWKNNSLSNYIVPTTSEMPDVEKITNPMVVNGKEYFAGTTSNNITFKYASGIYENNVLKNNISAISLASIGDAIFW